ncbi:hypothetical protein LY78DRAFT_441691 [Colletotrichum sublineola]|nr:hypothetical protein LY78DRAFT_441691 [Colletotrichum sublineola]
MFMDGRPRTLAHVTRARVTVRYKFCDVSPLPLPPPAAPPVTVIPSSPSCESSAPWKKLNAITTLGRGRGKGRGGKKEREEGIVPRMKRVPPSLPLPPYSSNLSPAVVCQPNILQKIRKGKTTTTHDYNVLPWNKLWARRYIVLPRPGSFLTLAIPNRSPDGPGNSSSVLITGENHKPRKLHVHAHAHVLISCRPCP